MIYGYSMLSSACVTLILSFVFFFLSKQSDKEYMRLWGKCWFLCFTLFFVDFLNFQELFNPELYLPTRQAVIVIAAYSFLKGTFHFFQAKLSRIVLGVVILSLISIGLSGIFPEIYNMAIIPNIICSSSLLIGAGCMFISYSWTENLPEKIGASFLIILWALFVNHFGFTITHRGIAIGTYFIGIFIITLLILLLMIIHFKKLRFLDQKQASRFRLLVENSSDCMFLYDYRSFSFEYASGSIGELIGTSRKTLYADPEAFFEFLTAEDGDSTIFSIFKQPLLRPCSNVLSYRSEEGLVKWVEIHCLPIIDPLGNVSAVEGILRDITKPREMMIQLAETEEEKKNLIENISHEIRTPITLIQGYAESLMDEIVPKDAYPTYLKMMHSKALMLNTLLEDLIRVSTFTSQELEYKFYETSVKKYFDNVIAQCKFQIEQSGHFFQGECQLKENIMMIIDEQRILQVISNMTNNAIRHTPKFSLIQVRCISIPTKEDRLNTPDSAVPAGEVVFSITDSGDGIPPEDLPHLFNRGFRGKNAISPRGTGKNSGLGLFIAQQIIGQHSGRIVAKNNEGQGATLYFSIPYYEEED